jgi:mannose/cellobiose epimerase-like protein (N-acyl-D-glucosamine 2-epimerase family)
MANSKGPPKKQSNPAMVVVEAAFIASEFTKDFEKLMDAYKITEYDVSFKGSVFQLRFQKKKA